MKTIFYFFLLSISFYAMAEGTALSKKSQVLKIFDPRNKDAFDSQVAKVIQNEFASCKECSFVNLASYDEKGRAALPKNLESAWGSAQTLAQTTAVLLLNWNVRFAPVYEPWVTYLNQASEAGLIVAFAAGQPGVGENSAALSQTLAGKIPHALVIGELGERDRLWAASFFGPEMFTALRPARDLIGIGVAPVQFAARFVRVFPKRSDWPGYLQSKKTSSHKIWLELNDVFGP